MGQHCSFVELIRFATTGNNGNCLSRVLRGGLPPDPQNVPINFHIGQQTHRTVTLRRWLINAGGPKHHPVVVISKSIFKVLCEHAVNQQTGWLNLSPEHWRQAQEWFAEEGHIYPLPGFGDRDWIITAGFPYFRGWEGQAIEDCLHDLAEMLGQRLIRFH